MKRNACDAYMVPSSLQVVVATVAATFHVHTRGKVKYRHAEAIKCTWSVSMTVDMASDCHRLPGHIQMSISE